MDFLNQHIWNGVVHGQMNGSELVPIENEEFFQVREKDVLNTKYKIDKKTGKIDMQRKKIKSIEFEKQEAKRIEQEKAKKLEELKNEAVQEAEAKIDSTLQKTTQRKENKFHKSLKTNFNGNLSNGINTGTNETIVNDQNQDKEHDD